MILDTSAIIAAITNEPDGVRFRDAMLGATSLAMSAVAVLETEIVLEARHGTEAVRAFGDLIRTAGIVIVAFDAASAARASEAFRTYGKGRGHPAQLNIIDCAVYALAKLRGEALLFKGDDFSKTDITPAFEST